MIGLFTITVISVLFASSQSESSIIELKKLSPDISFVNSALQFYAANGGNKSGLMNSERTKTSHQLYGSKSAADANKNYIGNTIVSHPPSPSKNSNTSIIKVEPMIQWVSSNDFMELISYLAEQTKYLPKKNYVIVDTRNSNEYNGWKSFTKASTKNSDQQQPNINPGLIGLYDQKNGHITHAHNFDADWLSFFDPKALNNLVSSRVGLSAKDETYEKNQEIKKNGPDEKLTLVLYDTRKSRLERVKNYLVDNFVLDLVYLCQVETNDMSDFILKSNHSGNLFFQEPFYDMLLSADVLFNILKPYNRENHVIDVKPIVAYKLFDISQGGSEKYYDRSHIPTAVHVSTHELEDERGMHRNRSVLAKLFLELGIAPNNTDMVILYGNPDPLAAYRCALLMKWLGVKNIHVLNGGFRAWLTKYPIEVYANKRSSSLVREASTTNNNIRLYQEQSYAAQTPINYIVDQSYVADLVKNSDVFAQEYLLVDVRSLAEYMGEVSGYANLKAKGRIPTAVWGKGGSSTGQLEDYRNPDLTMRSGVEILRMWDELGIDYRYKHLIFYCGNGWRSSEVMYYAELMGLYRISLYDGGWIDWVSNPKNPIDTNEKAPPPPPSTFSSSTTSNAAAATNSNSALSKKAEPVSFSSFSSSAATSSASSTTSTQLLLANNTAKYYYNNNVELSPTTMTTQVASSIETATPTFSFNLNISSSSKSYSNNGAGITNKPSKFIFTTNKTNIYTNKDPYKSSCDQMCSNVMSLFLSILLFSVVKV